MVLKQVGIFGDYTIIAESNRKKSKKKKNKLLQKKIGILYSLYRELYEVMDVNLFEQRDIVIKGNIIIYPEERQAEPMEINNLNLLDDIDERIKVMEDTLYNEKYKQLQFDFMKDFQKEGKKE